MLLPTSLLGTPNYAQNFWKVCASMLQITQSALADYVEHGWCFVLIVANW